MYENLVYATPGPDRRADPQLLQGRELRRARPARSSAPTARARASRSCATATSACRTSTASRARTRSSAPATRAPRTACSSWTCCATPAAPSCPASPAARTRRWTPTCGRSRPTPRPTCRSRSTRPTTSTAPRAPRSSRTCATTSPASTSTSPRRAPTRRRCRTSTRRSASRSRTGSGTDVIATAALIGGIFGKGGGDELGSALALEEAKDRYGGAAGEQAWRDFRRQDDPEAPTTVKSRQRLLRLPARSAAPAGVALPDEGSLVDPPNNGSSLLGTGASAGCWAASAASAAMSNALLVSGAESESGRPVAVMGPQVAYFMPQILLEHGPARPRHRRRRAPRSPGVSPYVLLGRGQDFAWSATSAGQDIIDTFAEKLCEPDGSQPDVQSTHYLYKGECRAMETLTRVEQHHAEPGRPLTARDLHARRRSARCTASSTSAGTVDGQPVAFARQRSTYFHEADSARAFANLNRPSKVQNVEDFQRVVHKINFTFNWFYADDRDIGYFNSGDNPVRAAGRRPRPSQLGHRRVRLAGLGDDLQDGRLHALRGAPAGRQPGLHHLLEQQAGAGLRLRRRPVRVRAALPLAVAGRADRAADRGRRQDEPAGADRLDGGGRHRRTCARPRCCR